MMELSEISDVLLYSPKKWIYLLGNTYEYLKRTAWGVHPTRHHWWLACLFINQSAVQWATATTMGVWIGSVMETGWGLLIGGHLQETKEGGEEFGGGEVALVDAVSYAESVCGVPG
jgi:hypothetical protein